MRILEHQSGMYVSTLRRFATELETARAYGRRTWAEFGIHAWLNFPDDYPPPAAGGGSDK